MNQNWPPMSRRKFLRISLQSVALACVIAPMRASAVAPLAPGERPGGYGTGAFGEGEYPATTGSLIFLPLVSKSE